MHASTALHLPPYLIPINNMTEEKEEEEEERGGIKDLTAGTARGAGNGAKDSRAEKEKKEKELRDMLENVGV